MNRFRKKKIEYVLVMLFGILYCLLFTTTLKGNRQYEEYEVKAAFLKNFLLFSEFPELAYPNSKEIIIGIIGKDPSGDKFKVLQNKIVNERKIVIKYFKRGTDTEELKHCQLLFFSPELLRSRVKKLIDSLCNFPVLTVSEINGFIHLGGMINFVILKEGVKFKINKTAADNAGIKIRSGMLRNAIEIIGSNHAK